MSRLPPPKTVVRMQQLEPRRFFHLLMASNRHVQTSAQALHEARRAVKLPNTARIALAATPPTSGTPPRQISSQPCTCSHNGAATSPLAHQRYPLRLSQVADGKHEKGKSVSRFVDQEFPAPIQRQSAVAISRPRRRQRHLGLGRQAPGLCQQARAAAAREPHGKCDCTTAAAPLVDA